MLTDKLLQKVKELEDLNQRLRQDDRRKDEFLGMLAHELRNPLAPVMNALQIMRLPNADGPTREHARAVAERQVGNIARLLDDLLDFSRITRGKIQLRQQPISVSQVIGHAIEAVRGFIESRRHELVVTMPEELLWVNGDRARLEQVLVNLLNNAAKYTEPGGRIRLTAERINREVVLRVQDNGVGITPEILPAIFDLFSQADRSLDRAQGGLGIGLTLVKKLVKMHGGTVSAFSAGPDQGSEFTVRLPLFTEAAGETPVEQVAGAIRNAGRLKKHVSPTSLLSCHPKAPPDRR